MKRKVVVCFDSGWVLSKRNEDKLPVEVFSESILKMGAQEILGKSLVECTFVIDQLTNAQIMDKIKQLMASEFSVQDLNQVMSVHISSYEPPKKAEPPKKTESEQRPAGEQAMDELLDLLVDSDDDDDEDDVPVQTNNTQALLAVKKRIDALVGAEEFKALAAECIRVAPGLRKHKMEEAFTRQCYLFAINDGYGLSTYLELFADLIAALGLVNFGRRRIYEEKISAPSPKDGSHNPFSSASGHLSRYSKGEGAIICVDISEWMNKCNDKRFREFLTRVEDSNGNNIVIFRVPFVEKDILSTMKKTINDVLTVRNISFVPFDLDELRSCAQESIVKTGYTMAEDAWEVFTTRLAEEKSDGRFYGINTVNKIIREMIYLKQLSNAGTEVDDAVIKKDEITDLAISYRGAEQSGIEMLDDMVGMELIKQRVQEIVVQIETSLKNDSLGSPCIHMRFVGNPGTGKTTVARVLGKVLKERGVLRNGSFFEYAGRDFCGQYVGETAPKTAAMCRDAYGSVMFIDEAYSLYRGNRSTVDYGREAIDTLIAEMENHRSDLVVIMAGYPAEMAQLMEANPGLASRMPYIIEFPNYTREQLTEIFMRMVKKSFAYAEGFEEAVSAYFGSLPEDVVTAKEFSNARFVRNLFERTWCKAVLRAQLNKEENILLNKEDFLQASGEKEFKFMMEKKTRTLGFV